MGWATSGEQGHVSFTNEWPAIWFTVKHHDMLHAKTLLRNVFLAALVINGLAFAAQWFALSPNGHQYYIQYSALLIIPVMLSLLLVPIFVLLLISRPLRSIAILAIAVCVTYGVTGWALFYLSSIYRMTRFETVGEQSTILVQAIKQYESDQGEPPPLLESLVPRYIPSVPRTGMGAYPDYEYNPSTTKTDITGWAPERRWNLYIDIPLNSEQSEIFIYYPKQVAPQEIEQKVISRLGDWIYIRH